VNARLASRAELDLDGLSDAHYALVIEALARVADLRVTRCSADVDGLARVAVAPFTLFVRPGRRTMYVERIERESPQAFEPLDQCA
jgi:hypothetical protein